MDVAAGMRALKSFSLRCFGGSSSDKNSTADTYDWMASLERVGIQMSQRECGVCLLNAILGSCFGATHVSVSLVDDLFPRSSVIKVASLPQLQMFELHGGEVDFGSPDHPLREWDRLVQKLTRCSLVKAGIPLRQLPKGLQALATHSPRYVGADEIGHLTSLKELCIHESSVCVPDALTALGSLTKLRLRMHSGGPSEGAHGYVRVLGALTGLRQLGIDVDIQRSHEALDVLAAGVATNTAEVQLGLFFWGDGQQLPGSFLGAVGDRLVALRVHISEVAGSIALWKVLSQLPPVSGLLRLQLEAAGSGWEGWVRAMQGDTLRSLRQLVYLSLVCGGWLSEQQRLHTLRSACAAFPRLQEVCVHGAGHLTERPFCHSCAAAGLMSLGVP